MKITVPPLLYTPATKLHPKNNRRFDARSIAGALLHCGHVLAKGFQLAHYGCSWQLAHSSSIGFRQVSSEERQALIELLALTFVAANVPRIPAGKERFDFSSPDKIELKIPRRAMKAGEEIST
ncbi:hypothetical protein CEXT_22991 [Caerostris extrusa]|uniref:Uncharacterized protein n=1 Tax=Caerostris extrusa TaxID=172846 RepID=A0AAV4XGQ9_CAEEX|nr:hypothetical protein CEXT_22991 [Caerostris extrusa]